MPNSALPYETSVSSTLDGGSRVSVTDISDMAKLGIRTKRLQVGESQIIHDRLPPHGQAFVGSDVLVAGTRPSEWSVLGPRGSDVSHLVPTDASTVDLTHGRSAIRITGIASAELLAQLCSLDFADDFTPNGAVISASVSDVMCDIIRDDMHNSPSYVLLFDRSFAEWFSAQLVDVATYLNQYPLRGQ